MFVWLVHENVEGARQDLNEGVIVTILERVKLIYMCLPLITNLGEQQSPHSWVCIWWELYIWVCRLVPPPRWKAGTKTLTKGSIFPWIDGILAEDREKNLLLHKIEGNFLLPCWKCLLPKILARLGENHRGEEDGGEEQVKEENK